MRRNLFVSLFSLLAVALAPACDDDGTEADRLGIGWECTSTPQCLEVELGDGGAQQLECLTGFAGGYCGLTNCTSTADCPEGSICVLHEDAQTYCFRRCTDKPECNLHRSVDSESNCSSNFDWATPADDDGSKACIPPSSGI